MLRPITHPRNFPLLPTVSFEPHLIDGPLGPINTGNDVFSIVPLRRLAAERNSMLFYLDDPTLCLAGSGGAFSFGFGGKFGPFYGVEKTDDPAWFQGTLMMLARWVQVVDRQAPRIERNGTRIAGRTRVVRYVQRFVQNELLPTLPEALAEDPLTMTLLAQVVRDGPLDPTTLTFGESPLCDHAPFARALADLPPPVIQKARWYDRVRAFFRPAAGAKKKAK